MALKDMWERGELAGKTLAQIVGIAGSGVLRDGEEASREFREYLSYILLVEIRQWVDECLQQDKSGKILQDIVNEIGRRLDFQVEDGLYQGRSNRIGYDGLWQLPDQKMIVIEAKTTDIYAVNLDTIAGYRRKVIKAHPNLDDESVSILLVVGRENTGVLEEQIRGSRHAWDMRVISVDALLKIAEAKKKMEYPTFDQIHQILIPHESIRLDSITELALSIAAGSSKENDAVPEEEIASEDDFKLQNEMPHLPVSLRDFTVQKVELKLMRGKEISKNFVCRTPSVFSTPDYTCFLVCMVSRKHGDNEGYFWFALGGHHVKIMKEKDFSWIALCCGSMDDNVIFLIPWKELLPWLPFLSKTKRDNNEYFHVVIVPGGGEWILRTTGSHDKPQISQYLLPDA